MPPSISPLSLIKRPAPFSDPDWIFEVKYDGFRSLAYIGSGTCRLVSRNGNTFQRFKDLSRTLSKLPHETVLDGELACVDNDGLTQFDALMSGQSSAHFFAFDILLLDGEDLRDRPCLERKHLLKGVTDAETSRLHYVDHIVGEGERLFDLICQKDMEGIVAKPADSLYRESNGKTPWIKIKNPDYSQAVDRGEWFN